MQIFRIGDFRGRPYLEMEYVDGGSLADRLDGRPWKSTIAARLIEPLAMAVHHAHVKEIVHRDLKPANILLAADGVPKVTDFGLAKRLGTDIASRAPFGHRHAPYMAPEQAGGGQPDRPGDRRLRLGAILYELLTGRPPFRAASVLDTFDLVRSADPAASRIRPGLPVDLETIVLSAFERNRAAILERAELSAELHRFRNGEPIRARPVGLLGRAIKLARHGRSRRH